MEVAVSAGTLVGTDFATDAPIHLPLVSRMQGLYVLGKAGMGKSNFLLSLIRQDIEAGYGVCVLDPHGDLVVDTLACVPISRETDVLLLDLQDTAYPFAFDLFAGVDARDVASVAAGAERVVSIFKKAWEDSSWGPRLEDLLAIAAYTLLANPGTTLADLPRLLTDADYRQQLVAHVPDVNVVGYWQREYDTLTPRAQTTVISPLMNKVRTFLRNPLLARIVSQTGTTIDFPSVLAKRQILLVRLDPELAEATNLLGAAIVLRLLDAALGRRRLSPAQRPPFMLYADEFQRFATPTFGRFLEEARKYAVATTLAHQHRHQLSTDYLRAAVKGALNLVCFQLQHADAREMSREFANLPPELPRGDVLFWAWRMSGNTALEGLADAFLRSLAVLVVRPNPGSAPLLWQDTYAVFAAHLRQLLLTPGARPDAFPVGYHYSMREDQLAAFAYHDAAGRREETKRRLNEIAVRFDVLHDALRTLFQLDEDTLARLPTGQAGAKLQLADGMHQHRVAIPLALAPEHSHTVHAMLKLDTAPGGFTTPLTQAYVPAGERARRIRQRNRRRYQQSPQQPQRTPPKAKSQATPQQRHQAPSPRSPQPPTKPRSLPVVAEVDLDEE